MNRSDITEAALQPPSQFNTQGTCKILFCDSDSQGCFDEFSFLAHPMTCPPHDQKLPFRIMGSSMCSSGPATSTQPVVFGVHEVDDRDTFPSRCHGARTHVVIRVVHTWSGMSLYLMPMGTTVCTQDDGVRVTVLSRQAVADQS